MWCWSRTQNKCLLPTSKSEFYDTKEKTISLCRAEIWRTTTAIIEKNGTSNYEHFSIREEIGKGRWKCIKHILRKPSNWITKQALNWDLQGKRKRGEPKNISLWEFKAKIKRINSIWEQHKKRAYDRVRGRFLIGDWCCIWSNWHN